MSKLIDALIDEVRESTENEEFDDVVGLTEEEIVKFINDAHYRLHAKIIAQHPDVFLETEEQDVTLNTEAYDINFKAAFKNRVAKVEYSHDGNTDNYYVLKPTTLSNRASGVSGQPLNYIRRSGQILITPVPISSQGKLRITYTRKVKRMDKRRCTIVTINGTSTAPTSLEVNYVNGSAADSAELAKRTRLTIVDKYGDIKMDNILLSSIDTSVAGNDAVLTLDTSLWTPETGEEITTSHYILSGRFATTHSELEEEVERYIQAYVVWKILKRDSSVDSQEAIQELSQIENDIVDSYADLSDDTMEIPEINDSWGDDYGYEF